MSRGGNLKSSISDQDLVELILTIRSTGLRRKTSLESRSVPARQRSRFSLTSCEKHNEAILKDLVEQCDGTYGTAAEAVDSLSIPEVKTTRPYKTYTGKLSLGDWKNPEYEEAALYIDVIRFFKTKQRKPESASNFVSRSTNGATTGQSSHTIEGDVDMENAPPPGRDLAAIKQERKYIVQGVGNDFYDGKKEVLRDELAKGYEYGRTAVPISESDENVTKLETFEDFTIIGFIPWDKVRIKYFQMLFGLLLFSD